MAKPGKQRPRDRDRERMRRPRPRSDGQYPHAGNLKETIDLARKLLELRDAGRRAG